MYSIYFLILNCILAITVKQISENTGALPSWLIIINAKLNSNPVTSKIFPVFCTQSVCRFGIFVLIKRTKIQLNFFSDTNIVSSSIHREQRQHSENGRF